MSEYPENTPARPFKKKCPMSNYIVDGLGRKFKYEFSKGEIVWRPMINRLVPPRGTYNITRATT